MTILLISSHASDTERGEDGENREENGEYPAEVFAAALSAETVLKVVHGTAGPLACLVAAAEVDAEYVLGVVGHHSEKKAASHIQNTAPAPPMQIAAETPAILPVPTVAASAVQSA